MGVLVSEYHSAISSHRLLRGEAVNMPVLLRVLEATREVSLYMNIIYYPYLIDPCISVYIALFLEDGHWMLV